MRSLILLASLCATPALATGLDLQIADKGTVSIDLFEDVAPNHVDRITTLAENGAYDGIVFHRVIDGFMAQTGDVQFGRASADLSNAGMGGSDMPDLEQEFSDREFKRGTVGMARSGNSVDSANSQFFIMFESAPHLNGQYTVVGEVTSGMEVVDAITKGQGRGGSVSDPDVIESATVTE